MNIAQHKEILRKEMRRRLGSMSKQTRDDEARLLCAAVLASDVYKSASSVMGYLPISDELDISPILEDCLASGKLLSAPKIDWENKALSPVQIRNLQEEVHIHRHGVPEPMGTAVIAPASIDLIMTPALAFDAHCSRLGRGGGFYDRFLDSFKNHKNTFILGIAFEIQIVEKIPAAPHDQRVHAVATPVRWILPLKKPDFQSDQE